MSCTVGTPVKGFPVLHLCAVSVADAKQLPGTKSWQMDPLVDQGLKLAIAGVGGGAAAAAAAAAAAGDAP